MAPTKHSVLLAILAPFFGLPALAAPRPQVSSSSSSLTLNYANHLNLSQTSALSVSLVPVSTVSSMSYVPVVTSIATSAVTVTQAVPIETVFPTILTYSTDNVLPPIVVSSTSAMTISPIPTTSLVTATYTSLTHSPPAIVSTVSTTVYSGSAPLATVAPFVDVNTGNKNVIIGSTCQKKHNGRDGEIQQCIAAHQPRNICTASDFACQCYQFQQAVKCYKPQYHECKKDGTSLCSAKLSLIDLC